MVPLVLLDARPEAPAVLPLAWPFVEFPAPAPREESCGDAILPALGEVVRSPDIDPLRVVLSEVSRERSA